MTREDESDRRLQDLTIADMAAVTSGSDFWNTQALPDRGLPAMMVTDGPHGLRKQSADSGGIELKGAVPATCFPTAAGLASTWNPALLHEIGAALGSETRAAGVSVILGPGVNIKRHPLCGRNFEYLSEDPLLAGDLGAALVAGIQSRGVGASVKHFACNNQETNRARVSADVDERALREIYLRPFERVVRSADPWTLMTANNKINGTYASQHEQLLGILRNEWGFDGLVMSDWGSVYDRVAALRAGLDLEMPSNPHADREVEQAVRDGLVPIDVARRPASRMLQLADRVSEALADPGEVDFAAHHALARRAAAESCVLLTNDGILPLRLDELSRVTVVGAFASEPRYQGAGSSQVTPTRVEDALRTLRDRAQADGCEVRYAPGFALEPVDAVVVDGLKADAVDAARDADVVLVFLGLPEGDEAEGKDRTDFGLPVQQRALLEAVADANPRVVAIVANGSAVDLMPVAARARAVVESWLGGQASGAGIVDVLVGDVSPSGHLAETIPLRVEDCPAHIGWPGEEGRTRYGEGVFVGYRYYETFDRPVAFPFGHGLSYTTFSRSAVGHVTGDGGVQITVTTTNSGDRAGRDVIQVYARHPRGEVARPIRELVGFGDATLEPGAEARVTVTVPPSDLAYWSTAVGGWILPASEIDFEIGASSQDIYATVTVAVPGNGVTAPLTDMHTLEEWLSEPTAGRLVRAEFGVGPNDPLPKPLDDPDVFTLVGGTTMRKFAFFGMGIDEAALERISTEIGIR